LRNKERRLARENQKKKKSGQQPEDIAGSPSSTPAPSIEKPTGTTRKCANCGQAGHIKTNKKYYCSLHVPPKKPRGRPVGTKRSKDNYQSPEFKPPKKNGSRKPAGNKSQVVVEVSEVEPHEIQDDRQQEPKINPDAVVGTEEVHESLESEEEN
jgi:hypothetical protein